MDDRFRNFVYGVALAVMLGWVLYVGRSVFVPVVTAILIVTIITGLSRLFARLPVVGARLPVEAWHVIAVVFILGATLEVGALVVANLGSVAARAPSHQQAVLVAIQQAAASLGIEREPTWQTLRAEVLGDMDLQRMVRSIAASTSSLVAVQLFVLLNVAFLLIERRSFSAKIARLSADPAQVARIRRVIEDVNARAGRYLAVKTLLNVLLGVLSWAVMALAGLEFAGLWAMIIAIFNYIPYVGSFIGVAFPVTMAVAQFGDLNTVLTLLIALALAQILVGNVLEPMVMGDALNISPWVILISLTVWSSLWGIAGAVFSVPIAAIMVVIFSEFERTRPLAVLLSKDGAIGGASAADK